MSRAEKPAEVIAAARRTPNQSLAMHLSCPGLAGLPRALQIPQPFVQCNPGRAV